ncbi:LuxR C-terminal-related transcriptional regulator [Azonexus hydrophilus]|uniref:LuxR C-terminal-related transcriptional regulator n=1 Tax=Azonexus hydrophilus TaxID=418702 RepID=A0ABZ2XEZ5_9RHOO|nr:LuxR C-terminal-related transcriptional regulator [Azonexus hydrophilus]
MGIHHTGNAEIDQQHSILENMVEQLASFCSESTPLSQPVCAHCPPGRQTECGNSLASLTGELGAFLIGHATYEEKMMELLPDTPVCQAHIKAHKAAHEGIARQLKRLALQVQSEPPYEASLFLQKLTGEWLGNHSSLFDNRLVRLGKTEAPEIDFDAELVVMLDQHVFPNRPTTGSRAEAAATQRQRVEIVGRFESLTASQRKVFWLVVNGRKNAEIAEELGISVNTVKTHRSVIFQKFEVSSVVELLQKTDILRQANDKQRKAPLSRR